MIRKDTRLAFVTRAALAAALLLLEMTAGAHAQSAPPAGSGGEKMQGTLTVCFAHGTDKPVPCNRAGAQFVIVSFLEVGGVTWDGNGNACASGAETISVQGSAVSITQDVNFVGKMTSYDPSTQSGDGSGTGYSGGKCIGASFDNTGATERSNATFHFVISQGGKRLDSVLTSLSAVDQQIGTFSVSGTGFQQ